MSKRVRIRIHQTSRLIRALTAISLTAMSSDKIDVSSDKKVSPEGDGSPQSNGPPHHEDESRTPSPPPGSGQEESDDAVGSGSDESEKIPEKERMKQRESQKDESHGEEEEQDKNEGANKSDEEGRKKRVVAEIESFNDPVLKRTIKACEGGGYMLEDNPIAFDMDRVRESMKANRMFGGEVDLEDQLISEFDESEAYVESVDIVECALGLQRELAEEEQDNESEEGKQGGEEEIEKEEEEEEEEKSKESKANQKRRKGKVLLVNAANSEKPGGMKESLQAAGERDLLRRSNYFLHLTEAGHAVSFLTSSLLSFPLFLTLLAYLPLPLPRPLSLPLPLPSFLPHADITDHEH
jgi:Microbial-type PARG, catalytic domain